MTDSLSQMSSIFDLTIRRFCFRILEKYLCYQSSRANPFLMLRDFRTLVRQRDMG